MALESNIYALWGRKQTAKGTPAAAPDATNGKRLTQVAGDFAVARDDGAENFSDLSRFGSMTDYVNTIVGNGNPGVEAQPGTLGWLCYIFFGQDTVTGAADPWQHVFTPGTNGGFWGTFWKRVGQNTIQRQKFADCKISALTIEGSTGAQVVRATPTVLSLDPGETYATDPVKGFDVDKPFLYHEGTSAFNVDGTVLRGQSQFTATWDENLGPYYGDDVVPVDLVTGNASIAIAVTLLVDDAGLQQYNRRIYGTATPATATKPLKDLDPIGSYTFTLTSRTSAGVVTPARSFTLTIPGVRWSPDVSVPPNPDGGATEISLAGSMRQVGSPGSTITIQNGDSNYATTG